MNIWQKVRSQLWQRRAFYEKVALWWQERLHHAFISEPKGLLIRMSHEVSLEPLMVYHLDIQSSFRSCINYTNGTPQLCWSQSSWLQNYRFGLAVQSHRHWEDPSSFSLPCGKEQKPSAKKLTSAVWYKIRFRTSVLLREKTEKDVKLVGPKVDNAVNCEQQISP